MTANASDIRTIILTSSDLPTLPEVASKLLALTSEEQTSLTEIADMVAQDLSLATKILRVANSSYYSFPGQIKSMHRAVSILGINPIRNLLLSFSFLSLREKKNLQFDFSRFWECSLARAAAAKVIAGQLPDTDKEEHFIAGLLQNIGQLIFACTIPGKYEKILHDTANSQDAIDQEHVEQRQLGITHSEAGYEVARKWGLPDMLLHAIRFHHTPIAYEGEDKQLARTLKIVFLADLVADIFYSATPERAHARFLEKAMELLGFEEFAVTAVLEQVTSEMDMSAQYFGLTIPPTKSVMEILHEANVKLSLLSLSYEEMNRELLNSKIQLEKLTAELEEKNSALQNLTKIDQLTGIANHRYFQDVLDHELNRAVSNKGHLSLLLLDIDLFKQINDIYGHLAGDFILRAFCSSTSTIIRSYDFFARYGGEEFVVILPDTDFDSAGIVAEKLRYYIEKQVFTYSGIDIRITISIGVASACLTDRNVEKNTLIGWADSALYQAKRNGRNRVFRYLPERVIT
jgi:diguanylate cyclase (GGDEF)-like protein